MKVVFIVLVLFYSLTGFSGDGQGTVVGNGGDVVVCRNNDNSISSIELLDYFEARMLREGITIDLGPNNLSVDDKVNLVLARLERFSPVRAKEYRKNINFFMENKLLVPGVELTDIPDSYHMAFPSGCKVEQIVIYQKELNFEEDKHYLVNKELWDALNNLNKDSLAGLLLHEAIYKEAIETGHKNSIATRYFNSIISSNKIDEINDQYEFIDLISKLPFKYISIAGVLVKVSSIEYYPSGTIKKANVVNGSKIIHPFINGKVEDNVFFYENGKLKDISLKNSELTHHLVQGKTTFVSFYENGKIKRVCFSYKSNDEFNNGVLTYGENRVEGIDVIEFYENEVLKFFKKDSDEPFTWLAPVENALPLVLKRTKDFYLEVREIEFYKDGTYKSGASLAQEQELFIAGQSFNLTGTIEFYQGMKVKTAIPKQNINLKIGAYIFPVLGKDSFHNNYKVKWTHFRAEELSDRYYTIGLFEGGKVRSLFIREDKPLNFNGVDYVIDKLSTVYFYESGKIKCARFQEPVNTSTFSNPYKVKLEDKKIAVDYSEYLCFHEHRDIKSFVPRKEFKLKKVNKSFKFLKEYRVYIYPSGKLKSAILDSTTEVDMKQGRVFPENRGRIGFYENGNIRAFLQHYEKVSEFNINGKKVKLGGSSFSSFTYNLFNFYEDGNIKAAWLYEKTDFTIQGKEITFKAFMSFFPKNTNENIVKLGKIDEDIELLNVDSETKLYKKDSYLKFNENGFVEAVMTDEEFEKYYETLYLE